MIHLLLAVTIWVAPNGSDRNSGTEKQPLATLARARDAARQARAGGPVTVSMRAGTYVLAESLELTGSDSGTQDAPVVYEAAAGEYVRLIGGRLLPGGRRVRDKAVLDRLQAGARAHVIEFDLSGAGDLGALQPRGFGRPVAAAHAELFSQGRRMTLARWPDGEFAKIAAPGDPAPPDDGHGRPLGQLSYGFTYDGDRPSRWRKPEEVWVHGYWAWDWAESYDRISAINTSARLLKTAPPLGIYGFRSGQRYYYLNVLEELDQPGEYFVDLASKRAYFWPPADTRDHETAVSLLAGPLLSIRDASHLIVRGLTLEYGRGHGIVVEGGENVRIESCIVRNVGNSAVIVRGGVRHVVDGCDIYHTGDGGIEISGGDRSTLAMGRHAVINNDIHHMGEWCKTYHPAIKVSGVGNRMAHNLIHDGPHAGILLNGNEHTIEYNEFHHLALETGDVGAFYLGRDWTERGNVVRHNYFHHMGGVGMGSMSVYLDDCSSGTTVSGNIFYKVTRAAFIGGGRDNRVENNIFIDCDPAVHIDARCTDPRPVWHNMTYKTMKERLEKMNADQPPYGERYPELRAIEPHLAREGGVPPQGNRVVRNLISGKGGASGKWIDTRWRVDLSWIELKDNAAAEDLGFRDPDGRDFGLKDDIRARAIGFQPIPVEKIGPQRAKRGAPSGPAR